ncbi:hypothetical protein ABBQ38_013987 [Trebouxia sp. C0009 RCD-2024]
MLALHSPLLLQHKGPSLIPFVEHRWSQKASQRLSGRKLANSTRSAVRCAEAAVQRRHVLHHILLAATAGALSGVVAQPAQADVVRDLLKGYIRPEVAADQAIMQLMDARGTLMELKALAATAPNSHERFEARRVLPGMATRLRQVSSAAPVAAALASGTASESTLSYLYGGSAADGVSELSMAIPVYEAIGKVITISGRTIRQQAQASPEYAEAAINCISRLLAACPQEDLDRAQEMRKARTNVKAV